MLRPAVGLLPLYVALYDQAVPELRPRIERHLSDVGDVLATWGLDVVTGSVCRTAEEFATTVRSFEDAGVEAIITLHLAYSPSLEAEAALTGTDLPLIVLDTTPKVSFDERTDPADMMYNHGIHGVQDLCNRLIRGHKPFEIIAGHLTDPDLPGRLLRAVTGARMATRMRSARVGIVGDPFDGMGDFRVDFDELRTDLGVTVVRPDAAMPLATRIADSQVESELERDRERFEVAGLTQASHESSTRAGLALRHWIEQERLTAVTVSFLAPSPDHPMLPVMPFLECSKAMGRGVGYAGEGDVLTAALVGALLQGFPETTFTEMFCPDWLGGSVFLSHMGELNYRIADGRPRLTTLPFPYSSAADPAVAYASMRGGPATLVNLAPFGSGRYRLTIVPGKMRSARADNRLSTLVNGWFEPALGLGRMLEEYSRMGATHHSALVYADVDTAVQTLAVLGRFLQLDTVVLGGGAGG